MSFLLIQAGASIDTTPFPAPISAVGKGEIILGLLAIMIALVAWMYRDKDEII